MANSGDTRQFYVTGVDGVDGHDSTTSLMLSKLSQLELNSKKSTTNSLANGGHYDDSRRLLKFIPTIPQSYSFVDENFHSDAFSVDGFVKRNSRRVQSLEKLKEELTAYLKILKHSMVELINEDYTEFINLSANLISFDKSINNIKTPIGKFKEETSHVQGRIEEILGQLTAKQQRLKTIRDSKRRINMILEISGNLNRIEVNMSAASKDDEDTEQIWFDSVLDETATLLTRIQMNFDYLLGEAAVDYHKSANLLAKLKHRFDSSSRQFYHQLERKLYYLLCYDLAKLSDETRLNQTTASVEKILRIYMLAGRQEQLERLLAVSLIRPTLDQYCCDAYIAKHGVQSMFDHVLVFIDTKCALLIKVLTTDTEESSQLSTLGYELLTRTLWKQIVDDCIVRCSALFSLANADLFHRNYVTTFRFIEDFLYKTALVQYRDRFEAETSYHQLKAKFNLNVYFFMKLQQIVPPIERGFAEWRYSLTMTQQPDQYRTKVAFLVHESLFKCWQQVPGDQQQQKVFVGDLLGYLWKISLKIVARFASWNSQVNAEQIGEWLQATSGSDDKRAVQQTLAALITDGQLLLANFASLYQAVIQPLWSNYYGRLQARIAKQNSRSGRRATLQPSSLDASFTEALNTFHVVAIRHLARLLKGEIIAECTPLLDFVNDIPRLYRRTNKEKPSKASAYIAKCCLQLSELVRLIGLNNGGGSSEGEPWKREWLLELLTELTLHYKNATLEVLTSVQKTEDSLKKLKKAKPMAANRGGGQSSAMSDDDKIRLQIYYDVMQLGAEMTTKISLDLRTVRPYHELAEMVSSLKILV